MKEIHLSCGRVATVDDEDFERLAVYSWHLGAGGYYPARWDGRVNGKRKVVLMHHDILKAPSGFQTDHINGNGFDNRKANLRVCSVSQNMQNRRMHANNKTGFKGVDFIERDQTFRARITANGRKMCLGHYSTAELAAEAYAKASKEYHGQFARIA